MTYRTVSEAEFRQRIIDRCDWCTADFVTGPGRSGAIAAVYASHYLGIPFLPYRTMVPVKTTRTTKTVAYKTNARILVIDTATWHGTTLRKARRLYGEAAIVLALYDEPPMVKFWYEAHTFKR